MKTRIVRASDLDAKDLRAKHYLDARRNVDQPEQPITVLIARLATKHVACARCHAPAGSRCRSKAGRELAYNHAVRQHPFHVVFRKGWSLGMRAGLAQADS